MATERENKRLFIQPAHHMAAEGGCCWPHLLAFMHHPRPGNNHPSCRAVCDPRVPERAREASATRPEKGVFHLCAGACVHLRSMSVPSSLVSNLFFTSPPVLSIPPPLLSRAFLAHLLSLKSFFHCLFETSGEIISLPMNFQEDRY